MMYIACVTHNGKNLETIKREYSSKKAFYSDLRGNGYSVRFISTEEKYDEDCQKWHERNERSKQYHKIEHDCYKEYADKYGISVAHYRRAYKAYCKASDNCCLSLEDFIEIYK